jgi:hypothetical protein
MGHAVDPEQSVDGNTRQNEERADVMGIGFVMRAGYDARSADRRRHQYAEDFGKSAPPTGSAANSQRLPPSCPNRPSKRSPAGFSEIFGESYGSRRLPFRIVLLVGNVECVLPPLRVIALEPFSRTHSDDPGKGWKLTIDFREAIVSDTRRAERIINLGVEVHQALTSSDHFPNFTLRKRGLLKQTRSVPELRGLPFLRENAGHDLTRVLRLFRCRQLLDESNHPARSRTSRNVLQRQWKQEPCLASGETNRHAGNLDRTVGIAERLQRLRCEVTCYADAEDEGS